MNKKKYIKRNATDLEKIFPKHISNEELVPKTKKVPLRIYPWGWRNGSML